MRISTVFLWICAATTGILCGFLVAASTNLMAAGCVLIAWVASNEILLTIYGYFKRNDEKEEAKEE